MGAKNKKPEIVLHYERDKNCYLDAADVEDIANYYLDMDKLDEANEVLEIGLKTHKNVPVLNWLKLTILADTRQFEQIINEGQELYSIIKTSDDEVMDYTARLMIGEALCNLNYKEEADAIFEDLINEGIEDENILDKYLRIGHIYEDCDRFDDAIPMFECAEEIMPDNIEILESLACAHDHCGNNAKAAEYLEKALDLDAFNDYDWMQLGKNYMLCNEFQKAIKALDYANSIDPDNAIVMSLMGATYMRMGDNLKAAECFAKAEVNAPDELNSQNIASAAECYLKEQEYGKAAELLYKQVNSGHFEQETVIKLYQCLLHAKRFQECLFLLKDICKKHKNVYLYKMLLGDLYCSYLNDYKNCIKIYASAANMPADNGQAMLSSSVSALAAGDLEAALDFCMEAEIKNPKLYNLYIVLACIYFEMGNERMAAKSLKKDISAGFGNTAERFLQLCPNGMTLLKNHHLINKNEQPNDNEEKA